MVAESLQSGFQFLIDFRRLYPVWAEAPAPAPTLPEPVRHVAYMALLGIALLGMLMIVATLIGGHWVRRWGDRLRRPPVPPDLILPRRSPELPQKDLSGEQHDNLESPTSNRPPSSTNHRDDDTRG